VDQPCEDDDSRFRDGACFKRCGVAALANNQRALVGFWWLLGIFPNILPLPSISALPNVATYLLRFCSFFEYL
jgi:hypothetical protein